MSSATTTMQDPTTILAKRNGRFHVYWQGATTVAAGYGGRLRYVRVRGQPRAGFATVNEASAFEKSMTGEQESSYVEWAAADRQRAKRMGGTHLKDSTFAFCDKCGRDKPRFHERCACEAN